VEGGTATGNLVKGRYYLFIQSSGPHASASEPNDPNSKN
jgi:hypothetical protein